MNTVMNLNLRLEQSHIIPQIRMIPGYDYIHMLRHEKDIVERTLLNNRVFLLKDIIVPKKFVEKHNIKIIHAHHGDLGFLLLPFKEEVKVPMVSSIRGRDATLANQPVDYLKRMQTLFDKTERFFPVCNYLAEQIINWGCPPEKVRVLYGGVNLDKFVYRPALSITHKGQHFLHKANSKLRDSFVHRTTNINTQNILSLGRLVEKKGHHILIEAFSLIRDKFPEATLTIIGRGNMEHDLRALATNLNLGDSFRLLNHLHYDEVYEQLINADIFCAASLTATNGDVEGIPNTLKEAMATGLPVISTYTAGIPELVDHHHDGLLVQENNVAELAYALEYMLNNRDKWEEFGKQARQKIETKFNLNQQLLKQAEYYDELLNRSDRLKKK